MVFRLVKVDLDKLAKNYNNKVYRHFIMYDGASVPQCCSAAKTKDHKHVVRTKKLKTVHFYSKLGLALLITNKKFFLIYLTLHTKVAGLGLFSLRRIG